MGLTLALIAYANAWLSLRVTARGWEHEEVARELRLTAQTDEQKQYREEKSAAAKSMWRLQFWCEIAAVIFAILAFIAFCVGATTGVYRLMVA